MQPLWQGLCIERPACISSYNSHWGETMSMPPMWHDFHIKNTSKAIIEITLEKSHINAAIVTRPFYGNSITYIFKELTLGRIHINWGEGVKIIWKNYYPQLIVKKIITLAVLIWFHFSVNSLMNMKITFLQMIILGRDWKYWFFQEKLNRGRWKVRKLKKLT